MALKIRLTRKGAKMKPFYRIVVADIRSPRDGRIVEQVGTYDPKKASNKVTFDADKMKEWLAKGAIPSTTVRSLLKAQKFEGIA